MLAFLTRSSVCRTACVEVLRVAIAQHKRLVYAEEALCYVRNVLGACGECLNCQLGSNKKNKKRQNLPVITIFPLRKSRNTILGFDTLRTAPGNKDAS
mgnify:CR=1 FL=1